MRILVDLQGAQSESRFRGIGRYSLSLVQAMARQCHQHGHELYVVLNGLFPHSIAPIRAALDGLLPPERIRVWHAPGPVRALEPRHAWRRDVAERLREAFIADLEPDVLLISSLFEGYVDDAVLSIGRFESSIPVAVILYDLIPLLNPARYLEPNPRFAHYYQRQLEAMRGASLLLAISESSRAEGAEQLGADIPIVNISCAADPLFCPAPEPAPEPARAQPSEQPQPPGQAPNQAPAPATAAKTPALPAAPPAAFGLSRPFVLYSGGSDERKNLPRLLLAYAMLAARLRQTYQLVLAGRMPASDREQLLSLARSLGLQADDLLFTGYVSDHDLLHLYRTCTLFIMPSWHEGFGLPALEAMACGAPVIAANATSLPEVVGLDAALFDPLDPPAIAAKLSQALDDDAFRERLREHGLRQAQGFSWDASAQRALAALTQIAPAPNRETSSAKEHAARDGLAKEHAARVGLAREHAAKEGSAKECSASDWRAISQRQQQRYQRLIQQLAALDGPAPTDLELVQLAHCIDLNQRQAEAVVRATRLPEQLRWRIEGPFDSSYSLALLNREMARALDELGHEVTLHSTEGPGDFAPNPEFLAANPDLAAWHRRAATSAAPDAQILSRNLYPPRVHDMQARFNLLHAYGWEESAFPSDWVDAFNEHLQGLTLMSEAVRKIMIDNGVSVPLAVSGVGIDHWERIQSDSDDDRLATALAPAKRFRFLHVSSCFPRKGADLLLAAYGRAFRAQDDVSLIIKTFPNPHNQIHEWLAQAQAGDADFPQVLILEDDYPDASLKALYERCQVLVAPSRGEGFGLPMAEAMLSGLAVITTAWGGQIDFCTPETAWLIDYRFEPARTHFQLFDSVWAEPDIDHLTQLLREVQALPASERAARASRGRQRLLERFRWSHTAQRMVTAVRHWAHVPQRPAPEIGWITTWGTRCGIASYSAHLIACLPRPLRILAPHDPGAQEQASSAPGSSAVQRCWTAGDQDPLQELAEAVDQAGVDTLVIQFNYGFFDFPALSRFLLQQSAAGRSVVVTLHATIDPAGQPHKRLASLAPALARCQRILVHSPADLNRLKGLGLVANVALLPHGILDWAPPAQAEREWLLASYGFFLPHKGLPQLVEALALLRARGLRVSLRMVNAEYPVPESKQLIAEVRALITQRDLQPHVALHTDYLSDADSLQLLAQADLLVFPYQATAESASGAVRYGIASARPVAVTPLPIFADVEPAVQRLPGTTPEQIADGIQAILARLGGQDTNSLARAQTAQRWRESHRYRRIASRLDGLLSALHIARQQAQPEQAAGET